MPYTFWQIKVDEVKLKTEIFDDSDSEDDDQF